MQVSAESGIYHSYNNTYEYDDVGNIVSSNRTENTGTNVRYNTSYEYDKYGQLIRENNESFNKMYLYYYDNYGNIIYKAELPYTTENLDYDVYNNKAQTMYCGEVFGGEYVSEAHDDFISIQGVIPTCYEYDEKQRLVLSGDKAIGNYDAFGNPHLYNGKVLQWNGARLKKFGDYEFTYDSRGYRKQKLNGTELTEFLYDEGGKLLQERKPIKGRTCIITYLYEGDEVVGFTVPTIRIPTTYEVTKQMPFYYIKDVLGNITEIVDSNGAVVVKYYYDAWGNTQTVLNNTYTLAYDESINYTAYDIEKLNAFTYRGYYYDKDVSLYYLINRYYDPTTGRFISIDDTKYLDFSYVFGYNRYAYCCNNPVMLSDPTGKAWWVVLILVAVAVVLAGSTVAYGAATGETMMLDLSGSLSLGGLAGNVGVTFVFDFDDGIFEVYWHAGRGSGHSRGLSFTAGKVYGYEKRGDLAGESYDISGGYYGGVDASSNLDDSNPISTFGFSVGSGGSFYWGIDEYFQWF